MSFQFISRICFIRIIWWVGFWLYGSTLSTRTAAACASSLISVFKFGVINNISILPYQTPDVWRRWNISERPENCKIFEEWMDIKHIYKPHLQLLQPILTVGWWVCPWYFNYPCVAYFVTIPVWMFICKLFCAFSLLLWFTLIQSVSFLFLFTFLWPMK